MSNPVSETLLRDMVGADFARWMDAEAVLSVLSRRRRLSVELGLSSLTFEEWESALGRRHPDDPRPLHGGLGCIA